MRGSQALWTSKKKGQGGHQKQGTLFPALKIKVCCKVEREVGGGTGMGNTCKSMANSVQCMTKTTAML